MHNIGANIGHISLLDTTTRVYSKVRFHKHSQITTVLHPYILIHNAFHCSIGLGDGSFISISTVSGGW